MVERHSNPGRTLVNKQRTFPSITFRRLKYLRTGQTADVKAGLPESTFSVMDFFPEGGWRRPRTRAEGAVQESMRRFQNSI
jgi:hypothetical protein